jgi:hypothetical protein
MGSSNDTRLDEENASSRQVEQEHEALAAWL